MFLSSTKHIKTPKIVINLDNFQKDSLSRTILEYYDKGKFPTVKNVGLVLMKRKKLNQGSIHSLFIYAYEIIQFYSYRVCSDTSFVTLLLLYMCAEWETANATATSFNWFYAAQPLETWLFPWNSRNSLLSWNMMVHHNVHISLPQAPVLSQMNAVYYKPKYNWMNNFLYIPSHCVFFTLGTKEALLVSSQSIFTTKHSYIHLKVIRTSPFLILLADISNRSPHKNPACISCLPYSPYTSSPTKSPVFH